MMFYRGFASDDSNTSTASTSSSLANAVVLSLFLIAGCGIETVFAQGMSPAVLEEVEGELEILHEDSDQGSQYHYFLRASGKRISLQFAGEPPTDLMTGARIRARGARVNNTLALKPGSGNVETVQAAELNSLGEQRTLVMLVNFKNDTSQPYTVSFASEKFFGVTSNFFWENSYQQTFLSGAVRGWYTLDMNRPNNAATCNASQIASLADQAATADGVVLSDYSRRVYVFPQTGCSWWGLSSVGGNPSQSWINGTLDLGVTAHELGHALGLWHSHSLDCGAAAVIGANCAINEYGDIVDMMGASREAHYNSFQKERLGWLNAGGAPSITTVGAEGSYWLESYESQSAGPKALKILKSIDASTGAKTWYYIESRKALGFDSFLASEETQNITDGVLVRMGTDGNGDSSLLLDMTPATPVYYWWYDAALTVGQIFTDPNSAVTITVNSVSSSGAVVTVNLGVAVSVSTDKPSYSRNQSVFISALVQSNGVPSAGTPVGFTVRKSDGTTATGSATTADNGVAVYKLRLTKKDPIGNYQAIATAASSAATTTFTVR